MTAIRRRALAATILAAAVFASGVFWLLGTAGGARFLIAAVSRRAPFRMDVGRVSGRVAGDLRLGSVSVRWPSGEAEIEAVRLRWSPLSLLRGTVSIQELSLEGAAVELRPSKREEISAPSAALRWPSVAGLPARIAGRIGALRVSRFEIRRPGAAAVDVSDASARVVWKNGILTVSALSAKALSGTITGSLAAGFAQPSLRGALEFHALDLVSLIGAPTDLSGTVRAEGTPQRYSGDFSLRNRGAGVRDFRMAAAFAGDPQGLAVSRLDGTWLEGAVTGIGRVRWSGGVAVTISLDGRDLNPARIRPDWPGRIRFEFRGSARRAGGSPWTAEVDGRLLSSTLRHRPLTGAFRLRLDPQGLRVVRLELHGDGFDASVRGRPLERLEVSADIRRAGGLLPGAGGSARVDGWLRWRDGSLTGSLSASGRNLRLLAFRLDAVSLVARRAERDGPFAVTAQGRGVSEGALRIDSFSLAASGTPPRHTARLSLRSGFAETRVSTRGGFRAGTWDGTVTALSLREKGMGEWALAAPFSLTVSSGSVRVSPFVVAGPGGATVGASADLTLRPLRGSVRGEWNALDPALLDPWLARVRLSGRSSGAAKVRWMAAGRVALSLRADAAGTFFVGDTAVAVRRAEAELQWDPNGLSSRWKADLPGKGTLGGAVTSGEPARLGVPAAGEARAQWQGLDLSLLSAAFPGARLRGTGSGSVVAAWRRDGRLNVSGSAALSGSLAQGRLVLDLSGARVVVEGNEQGVRATVALALRGGGTVTGNLHSDQPARNGIPERGKVRLSWNSIDLALLSPWIPEGLHVEGTLAGSATGEWLSRRRFLLDGEGRIASGKVTRKSAGGEVSAALRSATVRWRWQDDAASGEIALVLAEQGDIRARFRIPLPARFPLAVRKNGPVEGSLSAKFREKGLLSTLFPGTVGESTGDIDLALSARGSWDSPVIDGTATLSHAGAYLPDAGIRLEDVELQADLAGREIQVRTFAARSGKGNLRGTATIRLDGWRIVGYEASLKGKDFLTLNVPEVRLTTRPDLSIEGTTRRVKVRGSIEVPDLYIRGRQTPPPVPRSEDVIIVDEKKPSGKAPRLSLDLSVKVTLGKHALVKAQGIDARLEGGLTLVTDAKDRVIAQGEIRVAQGSYAVYGIRLKITRGILLFAGVPVERPTLDVLAIRTVGDVKAGVEVAGTLKRPVVKLYSEPSMEDTDVLSYIVLGHPLGQQQDQAEPLMLAAGALLPIGQSAVLQDRLKRRFGLDVIEVQSPTGKTSESLVTVGKYLSPHLYTSYGRSIFTGSEQFTVRYDFGKRWQIQSQIGQESGADLFYKIEFR